MEHAIVQGENVRYCSKCGKISFEESCPYGFELDKIALQREKMVVMSKREHERMFVEREKMVVEREKIVAMNKVQQNNFIVLSIFGFLVLAMISLLLYGLSDTIRVGINNLETSATKKYIQIISSIEKLQIYCKAEGLKSCILKEIILPLVNLR
jgi:hypothetical protein